MIGLNNNEVEMQALPQENKTENVEISCSDGKYKEEFSYSFEDHIKFGTCLLCQERNLLIKIKMLDGNTKGIILHLKKEHSSVYLRKYAKEAERVISSKQRTLFDMKLNVS